MQNHESDEVDLIEVARTLWLGRKVIAIAVLTMAICASTYLNLAERRYSVSMVLKSVQEPSQTSNIGGLGGLASLAGVELPSGSNVDFASFPLLMQSREVALVVTRDDELMRALYPEEWDAEANAWRQQPRSTVGLVLSQLKSIITGNSVSDYEPPDAGRLSEFVSEEVSAAIDSKSDLLNIKAEAADPEVMRDFLEKIVAETDQLIRQRFIVAGTTALQFYKEQLQRAQSGEHREALAQLIVQEEQKLMLATRSNSYVAEVLRGPDISMQPTSPKSMVVLALSFILGFLGGCGVVMVRHAIWGRSTV